MKTVKITKEQLEELVKQNYSIREIAKEMRFCCNDNKKKLKKI